MLAARNNIIVPNFVNSLSDVLGSFVARPHIDYAIRIVVRPLLIIELDPPRAGSQRCT